MTQLWKILLRLMWVSLALLLIVFSINNRQPIVVSLEPLGFLPPLPAYALLFAGIFIGLAAAAGVTGWLRLQGFAARRKAERRSQYLENQVSALSEDAHKQRARESHDAASDTPAISNQP